MIKGKYVGIVTMEFHIDDAIKGLLPFDQMREAVTKKINSVVEQIIQEDAAGIATVHVEQQFVDLWQGRNDMTGGGV